MMKKAVIIVAVVGLGVIATGTMLYYQVGKRGEDEIHLLPEGYTGSVFIIFNQPDGQEKEYEDGKRVYKIPPDGILKTQFPPNDGQMYIDHYYSSSSGIRKELESVLGKDINNIQDSSNVYVTAESVSESLGNVDRERYYSMSYIVGKPDQLDSIYERHKEVFVPDLLGR